MGHTPGPNDRQRCGKRKSSSLEERARRDIRRAFPISRPDFQEFLANDPSQRPRSIADLFRKFRKNNTVLEAAFKKAYKRMAGHFPRMEPSGISLLVYPDGHCISLVGAMKCSREQLAKPSMVQKESLAVWICGVRDTCPIVTCL